MSEKSENTMGDLFFLSIQPALFNIATASVTELLEKGQLVVKYNKIAQIKEVKPEGDSFTNDYHYIRRIGVCARICMSAAIGMDPNIPRQSENCMKYNFNDPKNFTISSKLSEDNAWGDEAEQLYKGWYDRFYPHYWLEYKLNSNYKSLLSIMYVFRRSSSSSTELIQIKSEINFPKRYSCTIKVTARKADIQINSTELDSYPKTKIVYDFFRQHGDDNTIYDPLEKAIKRESDDIQNEKEVVKKGIQKIPKKQEGKKDIKKEEK